MNKDSKQRLDRIARLGCMACRALGIHTPQVEIHHVRRLGTSKKRENAPEIPLCSLHHRNGGFGVAIHAGRETWEKKFGTEIEMARQVEELIGRMK